MRHCHYTLTPADVRFHAGLVLQGHLRLADHGPKCTAATLWAVLLYAACRISSLAAACAALRDAPSDSAARDALLATLPDTHELQRRVNRALRGDLPGALRRRPQPLAIDLHLVPYHGRPLRDEAEVYRGQAKSGTSHFHAYATCYVIRKGLRFTLALTAVRRGEPLPDVVRRLLAQAAKAGVRPRYLLLDRGFCSVAVIRALQAGRRRFLMPLPLRGRRLGHPDGPSGSRVFAAWKRSGWSRYTLTAGDGRRATVSVCVKCRNRRGERGRRGREALVYAYGGGLRPGSYRWVKETYRTRFAIETTYRQLGQARIRTSTRDPLLRLLYVAVALILRNVWVWLHWQVLAERRRGGRRVDTDRLTFRTMLLWLQHWAEECFGICDEIHTKYRMYD
ncbi:MAG: peptide synthetase [Actinobacteria bacterium]|nr:peptide synthetase [Actinomycetota bacterium]